jgi:hypothetical protein
LIAIALIVVVALKEIADEYFVLSAVGAEPSTV